MPKPRHRSWTPMAESLGPLWSRLCRRFFADITLQPERREELRRAAAQGSVVYVLRSLSALNYLVMNDLALRYELPLSRQGAGLSWLPWLPLLHQVRVGLAWIGRLLGRGGPPAGEVAADLVRERQAVTLYLRRPRTWQRLLLGLAYGLRNRLLRVFGRSPAPGGRPDDLLLHLVRLQRELPHPIFLCPQILIWDRAPPRQRRSFFDAFFGEKEFPGLLREIYLFLRNRRRSVVRGGPPLALPELMATFPQANDQELAERLSERLLEGLSREQRVVTGPELQSAARSRARVLGSPAVQAAIHAEAEQLQQPARRVHARAERIFDRMAADMSVVAVRWLDWFLSLVWSRIYRGIELDEAGMERMHQAALRGPMVLVPSHKSHVDYLILSQLCWWNDLRVPLIVAGDNLAIPVVGWIFRKCGAFFLRRSFKGDALYKAVLTEYLQTVLADGHHVEFFLEGGRSRTGKLREPRMGLLSMVVDAVLDGRLGDLSFVPVSVGYERVIEAESYVREQSGAPKTKESLRGVLQSRKVLRGRFGTINVQIAAPFSLRAWVSSWCRAPENRGQDPVLQREARRRLVADLAQRIAGDINEVTQATPTALVATSLLGHERRGMYLSELQDRVRWLVQDLAAQGTRLSPLADSPEAVEAALDSLGRLLLRPEGLSRPVVRVRDERRLELAYSKNTLLHHYLARGMVACALLADPAAAPGLAGVPEDWVLGRARFLAWLLRREFLYGPGRRDDPGIEAALARLRQQGAIEPRGPGRALGLSTAHGGTAALPATLLRPFVDGYQGVVQGLLELPVGAWRARKNLQTQLGQRLQTLYHAGLVRYADSCSEDLVSNALQALVESGHLAERAAQEGDPARPGTPLLAREPGGDARWGDLEQVAQRLACLDPDRPRRMAPCPLLTAGPPSPVPAERPPAAAAAATAAAPASEPAAAPTRAPGPTP